MAAAEGASFREMFLGEKKKAEESLIYFLEADEQLPTMLWAREKNEEFEIYVLLYGVGRYSCSCSYTSTTTVHRTCT